MKIHLLRRSPAQPSRRESGAALLLSLLVLIVVGLIVYQIDIITSRDSRVATGDVTLTQMDLAIESVLLETYEKLADDAAATTAGDASAATAADSGVEGGEGESGPVDSKMDDWAQPQSTNVGDLKLRILIQDEDSKYNILNMLVEDEEQAEEAYQRVVRVIDNYREDTEEDIDTGQAEEMATAMRDHLMQRSDSFLPRPRLLTDDADQSERGMPLTLREFVVLEPFEEKHFRDYFDSQGNRVHGLDSFLTIHTSPGFAGAEDGVAQTGYAVNVNTAPLAVLNALFEPRDVDTRFWDGILEYRNEEEELDPGQEDVEPMLDEFGNEILRRKYFDDLEELDEVYDFGLIEPGVKDEVEAILSVESHVFSIYVTARVSTVEEGQQRMDFTSRAEQEEYERTGTHITRTVRSIVWRAPGEDGATIVPLLRWEVLPYAPLEVLDYDEDY